MEAWTEGIRERARALLTKIDAVGGAVAGDRARFSGPARSRRRRTVSRRASTAVSASWSGSTRSPPTPTRATSRCASTLRLESEQVARVRAVRAGRDDAGSQNAHLPRCRPPPPGRRTCCRRSRSRWRRTRRWARSVRRCARSGAVTSRPDLGVRRKDLEIVRFRTAAGGVTGMRSGPCPMQTPACSCSAGEGNVPVFPILIAIAVVVAVGVCLCLVVVVRSRRDDEGERFRHVADLTSAWSRERPAAQPTTGDHRRLPTQRNPSTVADRRCGLRRCLGAVAQITAS